MLLKIPSHPPKFEKLGKSNESDAVEVTLTYDEVIEYLRSNNIEETESGTAFFLLNWYMHYRSQGYRDEYAEHQFKFAFDSN